MVWTEADIEALKAAVLAIASGTRVVQVSYAGPPARSVTYQAADLAALRSLLSEVAGSAASGPSYRLAATRKGL